MSVTPLSGPQLTRNVAVLCHIGCGFTWDPGRTVSTIVHDSFVLGFPSLFPARSSAVAANSYVPSPFGAVKEKVPVGPPGCVTYGVHPPPWRHQRVTLPMPTPFPSDAVYGIVNVSAFSYVGRGLVVALGGVRSTMTKGCVFPTDMSTLRGSLAKLYAR